MDTVPFKIFNASAGSGKTFMLVKQYLKILLSAPYTDSFKQILAITFTNKAVNEMKQRIVENLELFSETTIVEKNNPMFSSLLEELQIPAEELIERAAKILKRILHNYAFFDVVTIDKFNHRLLRTFAFDLKLPMNFEVALDTELLLEEAIDQLIFKAGEQQKLTEVLISFALEKADDDKSWDIARDLKKIASLLLDENHNEPLEKLKKYTLQDFNRLNALLKSHIKREEEILKKGGNTILELIEADGIEFSDFTRSTLPKHFKKIANGEFNGLYENKLEENLITGNIYAKSLSQERAEKIDFLIPALLQAYQTLKKGVYHLKFLQNFYKNSVPLSLLNAIQAELETIKAENNLFLISEFNSTISKVIAHEPAPFIYERIGEKYRHYFIDEFQDTSQMQWNNLIPLIGNAIESETLTGKKGSLLLVGDAKQAIYRWRGGKAEQFIDLYNDNNPFQVNKEVASLPVNYRSYKEVVSFNNGFFKHISSFLSNEHYKDLFENKSEQQYNHKEGGFVQLTFINKDEDENLAYCQQVIDQIKLLIDDGYGYNDICILTRKKKHGLIIANFLLENEIPIISSESLLLKNSPKINFLIDLIEFALQPKNKEIQVNLLRFLIEKRSIKEKHKFFSEYIGRIEVLFTVYSFDQSTFHKLPFLNAIEYAIHSFNLYDYSDAYLQFFLDEILDFSIHQNTGFGNFLKYWEKKSNRLSVVAPNGNNAVQIMTIHKSKGLEFPIVIYPYAQSNIYEEIDPKVWLPIDKDTFGIELGLFSKNKEIGNYNDYGATIYDSLNTKLELDQFNILYVALTRAIERLYIIAKTAIKRGGEEDLKSFSGLFINYLKKQSLWNEDQKIYSFGIQTPKEKIKTTLLIEQIPFLSNDVIRPFYKIITKTGTLWDTAQGQAVEKGNLYHFLLSKITYANELDIVLKDALHQGTINQNELETIHKALKSLLEHPEIKDYFSRDYEIYNEYDIYTSKAELVRPDRLAIGKNKEVIIIDYKTGSYNETFVNQLDTYTVVLEEMGFSVIQRLLVFINEEITIKTI